MICEKLEKFTMKCIYTLEFYHNANDHYKH